MTAEFTPFRELWAHYGVSWQTVGNMKVPASFDDVSTEYKAASQQASLIDMSWREKVKVSGADHKDFLHRLFTADIKKLAPGEGCRAAFLTPQGRIIADMFLSVTEDAIWLDMERGIANPFITKLASFIIMEDVVLENLSSSMAHLEVRGPNAAAVLSHFFEPLPPTIPHAWTKGKLGSGEAECVFLKPGLFHLRLSRESCVESAEVLLSRGRSAGLEPAGYKTWDMLRIEDGWVRQGIDTSEEVALPETGLDEVAVSGTKGCYPGQEVVARLETYQGYTRRMFRFVFDASAQINAPAVLFQDEEEAGILTSFGRVPGTDNYVGMGYIKKKFFERAGLRLKKAGKAIPVTVKELLKSNF